uniref:F5/8 type C domain-containing protein n=1 Tax=Ciona savignyi TaxID=51511 RepID=H2YC92_CIOSA
MFLQFHREYLVGVSCSMRILTVLLVVSFAASSLQEVFPLSGRGLYTLNYWQARAKCAAVGASLATVQDLDDARLNGYSHCGCGWLANKKAGYPMNTTKAGCGEWPGVHMCNWRETWDAFCYMDTSVIGNCSRPLGMEDSKIRDHQITATSVYHTFWNERWNPHLARLNKDGILNAWMPHHDGRNQYLQVDLGEPTTVTGIITQGAKRYLQHQFVRTFKIAYSKDGDFWRTYTEEGVEKIFTGNTDNETPVRNAFREPILARHVRFYPITYENHITLRMELYGCDMDHYNEEIERMRAVRVTSNARVLEERIPKP